MRSATQNQYSSSPSFREAAQAFAHAWRKKFPSETPAISHALSTLDESDSWTLICAETGSQLCRIDADLVVMLDEGGL